MLTFEEALFIVTRGQYSYPAIIRYGNSCIVQCDYCGKLDIPASIGFQQYDVCLICAYSLTQTRKMVDRLYPRPDTSPLTNP